MAVAYSQICGTMQGDGSTVVAVDRGGETGEGERMEVGEKRQPSYLDYIQLWQHIMDPSMLKVQCSVH